MQKPYTQNKQKKTIFLHFHIKHSSSSAREINLLSYMKHKISKKDSKYLKIKIKMFSLKQRVLIN